LAALAGYLIVTLPWQTIFANTLYLAGSLMAIGAVLYLILDPKMRSLIWYMYKSVMRWLTGVFVNIDPIGVLKSYVEDLSDNLVKMRKQIGILRGQMRKISTLIESNEKDIQENLKLAAAAKSKDKEQQFVLATRKAARLKDSNQKYQVLYQKMDVLYRILNKMHQNSEILLEDTKDQVSLKEQERKAIRASHSAMQSAMSVMTGDPDKRAMFEMAMEAVAEDVASKVGEMERFMEMSSKIMDSVDLQNGVFEEEGLKMLEQWEKESTLMLLDGNKKSQSDTLDLNSKRSNPEKSAQGNANTYDQLFE
ncbi:MAG: hypothetical protein KDD12_10910, partial [Lewinella sp.]|nr:hypothetical protein [Lewinella sp.]